ncbi:MAG TPA: pyridoxal-phosphate dependent enzyme [Bryobacteraceae bacterium]|nr:pyridoxal-phosphate dependent enzyme [Bryobacteraceae bacterium]
MANAPVPLHIRTPLLPSLALSRLCGKPVLLKMENMQPTGSFKIRGIGRLCQEGRAQGYTHFVSSSGGNAGYAAAYAGRVLETPVTVFVPETTPESFREQIAAQGAEVRISGSVWDEADQAALAFAQTARALYVPPFDHPAIWEGNSTLVDEVVEELGAPGAVVVSVGGGGLLCGVLSGLARHGLETTPVLAVETEGTASLAASLQAGRLVALDRISGIAKTLGARTVAAQAFAWSRQRPVTSLVVSDQAAAEACVRFADDHKCLVEPACGASLAAAYGRSALLADSERVVIIVCGGIGVSLETLERWRDHPETLGAGAGGSLQ